MMGDEFDAVVTFTLKQSTGGHLELQMLTFLS